MRRNHFAVVLPELLEFGPHNHTRVALLNRRGDWDVIGLPGAVVGHSERHPSMTR